MTFNANILPVFEQLGLLEEVQKISLPGFSMNIYNHKIERIGFVDGRLYRERYRQLSPSTMFWQISQYIVLTLHLVSLFQERLRLHYVCKARHAPPPALSSPTREGPLEEACPLHGAKRRRRHDPRC